MLFIFTRDGRRRWWLLVPQTTEEIPTKLSWPKRLWQEARSRFLRLPFRSLIQERCFIQALRAPDHVTIHHSHHHGSHFASRLRHFLLRQRIRHLLLLTVETIFLPVSGLAAFLPGPNVFFGVLALLMITHWQALRGIGRLLRSSLRFESAEILTLWEDAVLEGKKQEYPCLIELIEKTYGLREAGRILGRN